ncbi:MAG TPA: hypothetical protein VF865_02180 [Acidobacteriaceae bacterium]
MSDSETSSIIALQSRLRQRLIDLGMHEGSQLENLSRHLAHISVLGRNFAEHTLPLFLSLAPEHGESLASLSVSLKCDLDEIRDALTDVEPDLLALMQLLNQR